MDLNRPTNVLEKIRQKYSHCLFLSNLPPIKNHASLKEKKGSNRTTCAIKILYKMQNVSIAPYREFFRNHNQSTTCNPSTKRVKLVQIS